MSDHSKAVFVSDARESARLVVAGRSGHLAGLPLRVELRLDSAFDPLRGSPRFEALLKEPADRK